MWLLVILFLAACGDKPVDKIIVDPPLPPPDRKDLQAALKSLKGLTEEELYNALNWHVLVTTREAAHLSMFSQVGMGVFKKED